MRDADDGRPSGCHFEACYGAYVYRQQKAGEAGFPDGTNADGAARRCSFRNYGDIREANRPLYE